MIGTMEVYPQSYSPDFPLDTLKSFVNSPSSIRVRNVPKKIGKWNITNVFVTLAYPDNTVKTVECVLIGGVYVATVEGCEFTGRVEKGLTITANGKDENDNVVTGYVLGKGDIEILESRENVTPGETVYYVHLLDTIPETPKNGDMYKDENGNYVVFQNNEENQIGVSQESMESYVDEKVGEVEESIPTKTSELTNDSGFITSEDVPTKTSELTNDSGFITSSDIPAIPTKTSELTNDSGFVTNNEMTTVLSTKQDKLSNAQVSSINAVVDERKTVVKYDDNSIVAYDIDGTLSQNALDVSGKNIIEVKMGNAVTAIGPHCFDNHKQLVNVYIPNSVTTIDRYAFTECDSLTGLLIPESVTSIGDYAFYSCESLTDELIIPDSVTSIGEEAFVVTHCPKFVIGSGVTNIGAHAFLGNGGRIKEMTFKGKTLAEVQSMTNYPWSISDTSIIKTFNVASKEWVEERLAQLQS